MTIEVTDATPSDEGDWMLLRTDGLKMHYVHKCIFPHLVADLEARGHKMTDSKPAKTAWINYPRIVNIVGRPQEHIKIDSLAITLLSCNVETALNELSFLQERYFYDKKQYFKLKYSHACLVLTPDQLEILGLALTTLVDRADERDTKFLDAYLAEKGG